MQFDPKQHSHRRLNPLTDQWVLCSPHRALRPWQGGSETVENKSEQLSYDTKCYLCPNNSRVNGDIANPDYQGAFVFTNDFPAMQTDSTNDQSMSNESPIESDLFKISKISGTSKVICYTPKHNQTLATLSKPQIFEITKAWQKLFLDYQYSGLEYIQIFENKGQAMGCSNPHPHGQAWISNFIPTLPDLEFKNLAKFQIAHPGKCLLCEYVCSEKDKKVRVVDETDHFIAVVPYWAVWPFEVLVLSKEHILHIGLMDERILNDLSSILKLVTVRYDNLFKCDFPYSMGIHQAPLNPESKECNLAHFHIHFFPPLLRSEKVKKWMVGFEMLAEAQRDLTPEQAADRLRSLPSIHHYLDKI